MRSSALIVFSITSSSLSIPPAGQGVVLLTGGDYVASRLSGGSAKGSVDCELVVQARFWAVLDDSWIGLLEAGRLPLRRVWRL